MTIDKQYYECGCGDDNHTLFVHTDTDDPDFRIFAIGVQLAPRHNLWGRIRAAVKYIINPHEGRYSHWHATEWVDDDEVKNIVRLRDQCNRFLKEVGK